MDLTEFTWMCSRVTGQMPYQDSTSPVSALITHSVRCLRSILMVKLFFALHPCFLKTNREFVFSDSIQAIDDFLICGMRTVVFDVRQKRNQLRLFFRGQLLEEFSECLRMPGCISSR